MEATKQPKGKFGNVYMIDYSDDGIHAYYTVGMGSNGPYNDDNFDCEIIDGEPYKYNSGGGGDVEAIINQSADYPKNYNDCWVDFDLLSKMGLEFSEEIKSIFLTEPRLLVTADPKSGKNPLKIENETYSGFCHCSICGHMVDENDRMCNHIVYTPHGTDEYAGIGNDDIKSVWYALRYVGKEYALGCIDYVYGRSWLYETGAFDGEDIDDTEDDDRILEWCSVLKDSCGFCPATVEDAIMVWRGAQILDTIDNQAREKLSDDMAKIKAMILAYPWETAATKRPIHKDDLPITVDGRTITKDAYRSDFTGLLEDGATIDLTTVFIDHISMEVNEDENED